MFKIAKEIILKVFKRNKKVITVREEAVKKLYSIVSDYSDWYAQFGIYLPPDYATKPTDWTIALQKMKRAFELLHDEENEEGDLWEAKNGWKKYGEVDVDRVCEVEKEIMEGFTLFGAYLFYLNDPKKGVVPGK